MARNASFILKNGGALRRHRYIGDLRKFIIPAAAAIILQTIIYVLVIGRVGRTDWLSPSVFMALVPIGASVILVAFRRHRFPLTSSIIITAMFLSVAVALISSLRIPVSYLGILLACPVPFAAMAIANVRFHSSDNGRTAILDFPGAKALADKYGITVVEGRADIDRLLIDPAHAYDSRIMYAYFMSDVEIMPWTKYVEMRFGHVDIEHFDLSHIRLSPSQVVYAHLKRIFDIAFVIVTFPVWIVLAAITALVIVVSDGLPVLFRQPRPGYGGREFEIVKFRTMYKGASDKSARTKDRRIIPAGQLIRRLRLDESPQLWNVLKGQMSLIGPRPVSRNVAAEAEAAEPKFALRYLVAPGITGWAQVNSGYAGTLDEELVKLSYDLYYIKYQSFDLDLIIIFRTIRTLLTGRGAR